MKNLFKATLTLAIAVVMMSCGSVDSSNFIGEWTPDLSSTHLELSDIIPEEATGSVDGMMDEMKNEQEEVDERAILEFKDNGKVIVGDIDESKEYEWKVDGDQLHIFGLIEDGPPEFDGKEFDVAFEILDSSADKFTLKLSVQSLYDQIKAQFPKDLEEAEDNLGMYKMFMTEKVMSETWASISFKKKEAHS